MLEVKSAGTRLRLHLTADLATIFLADEIIMVVNCPGADRYIEDRNVSIANYPSVVTLSIGIEFLISYGLRSGQSHLKLATNILHR